MEIRRRKRGVLVKAPEGELRAGVPLEEVAEFLRRLWPWEEGRHFYIDADAVAFKDYLPFARAVVYVLARRSGLTREDAEYLASATRIHEVELIAGSLLYRLWLCREADCKRRVLRAFTKIARAYREVLPA
jgi:hypothetical protein